MHFVFIEMNQWKDKKLERILFEANQQVNK